jgi:hypothetical protein
VQLLCVRGDEAARTYKSREWYWLDANVNAEYCSTYRDALDAEAVRSKKVALAAAVTSESNTTEMPAQAAAETRGASRSISKTTVSLPSDPSFYCANQLTLQQLMLFAVLLVLCALAVQVSGTHRLNI